MKQFPLSLPKILKHPKLNFMVWILVWFSGHGHLQSSSQLVSWQPESLTIQLTRQLLTVWIPDQSCNRIPTLFFLPGENSYLLSTVRRKVEYKNSEKRDAHARNNKIDSVEQRFSAHGDVKSDIKVRLITAGVKFNVSNSGHCEDVPLNGHVKLGQVDTDVDNVGPLLLFLVP